VEFTGVDRTADGDYHAYDFSAYVGAGYELYFGRWTVTPTVSVDFTRYRNEAFEETGAGDVGLDIGARTQESLLSRVGFRLHTITNMYNMKLAPELFLGYAHEFMNQTGIDAAFAGGVAKFPTEIDINRENTFYYGAGLSGLLRNNISAFVRYEGELYSGAESNALKAGLTIKF
jgi:outer membrane autotransporter protein